LYRRSLMLFCSLAQGQFCAIFLKKYTLRLSSRCTLAFLSCLFLGTIASKNARTSVRLYLSPPASAGGVYYLFSFSFLPVPPDRERKGSNFFLPSNSFAKKKLFIFSALSSLPERHHFSTQPHRIGSAKVVTFSSPPTLWPKKFFLFLSPISTLRTSLLLQSGCKYRPSFFITQGVN
jgi:hypothetical protein